jgi:hypothetical protein
MDLKSPGVSGYLQQAARNAPGSPNYLGRVDPNADADFVVTGGTGLVAGENELKVTVTAADGTTVEEVIVTLNVLISNDTSLAVFEVNGEPVEDQSEVELPALTDEVEVVIETTDVEATYEISGDTNLEPGLNILTVTVTAQDGSTLDRIVGVGVAFPLPLWRPRTANIAAAEAKRQQAVAVLAVARREVERRVVSAARGYDSRLAELAHWRSDVVSQFESAAELADRHYRLGAVPATTYIELQKQYLDAVEAHLDTRREALAALLELEQATGLSLVSAPNLQPARP